MNINEILRNSYNKAIETSSVDVLIDKIPSKALVRESSDGDTNMVDYKTIISSTLFKQGSIVDINSNKYLVVDIEEQFTQSVYCKGTFRECQSISIGEFIGATFKKGYDLQAIVDKNNSAIIDTNIISLISDEMMFIVAYDSRIKINNYILYKNNIFKITSIDNSKNGLLILIAKFSTTSTNYEILLDENIIRKEIGNTYQINVICKADGVIVDNPVVTYSSNNEEITTVNNTGLVTCVGIGTTNIVCNYENVSANLTIIVNEIQVITYTINGVDNLKVGNTSIYTVSPEQGDIDIVLDDYTVDGGIAEIVQSTKYTVTVKALIKDEVATIQVLQNGEVKATKDIVTTRY